MEKNTLKYVKYPTYHELVAVPLLAVKAFNRLRKNEKLKDSLNIIIEKSRQKAIEMSNEVLLEHEVALFKSNYGKQNDFFSKNFNSKYVLNTSFEARIKFCLANYKEESKRLYLASEVLNLEENFLKGAQRMLPLYFFFQNTRMNIYQEEDKKLDKEKTSLVWEENLSLKNLKEVFKKDNDYNLFDKFLRDHLLLSENKRIEKGNKRIVANLLWGLMKKGVIHQIEGKDLSQVIAVTWDDSISESTFSDANSEWQDNEFLGNNEKTQYLLTLLYEEFKLGC